MSRTGDLLPPWSDAVVKMITVVHNLLKPYGVTLVRLSEEDREAFLNDSPRTGEIFAQTFQFEKAINEDDESFISSVLEDAGWGYEWFGDDICNSLHVSINAYRMFDIVTDATRSLE